MAGVVGHRLVAVIPTLLVVSFVVFLLSQLVPGDAASKLAGPTASPERVAEVRAQLHTDDPAIEQYARWLGNAVRLDLGESLLTRRTVREELSSRLPVTLGLVFLSCVVGLAVGVPLGMAAGVRPGRALDQGARAFAGIGWAMPSFWLATMLVLAFAVNRSLLPSSGYEKFTTSPLEWLRYMTLPAITLAVPTAAIVTRQLRAAMIDVLDANYVRAAWAHGGRLSTVLFGNGLRNAAIPVVTTFGIQIGFVLGGSVVVEEIFALPGLGSMMVEAIRSSDLPVIQGVTIAFVLIQVGVNLLVDLSYGILNPKVRVG